MATRKDYVAAAEAIRHAREVGEKYRAKGLNGVVAATLVMTNQLADYFGEDNARFDRDRFMQATRPETR